MLGWAAMRGLHRYRRRQTRPTCKKGEHRVCMSYMLGRLSGSRRWGFCPNCEGGSYIVLWPLPCICTRMLLSGAADNEHQTTTRAMYTVACSRCSMLSRVASPRAVWTALLDGIGQGLTRMPRLLGLAYQL